MVNWVLPPIHHLSISSMLLHLEASGDGAHPFISLMANNRREESIGWRDWFERKHPHYGNQSVCGLYFKGLNRYGFIWTRKCKIPIHLCCSCCPLCPPLSPTSFLTLSSSLYPIGLHLPLSSLWTDQQKDSLDRNTSIFSHFYHCPSSWVAGLFTKNYIVLEQDFGQVS